MADLDVTPSPSAAPLDERVAAAINHVLEAERATVYALVQLSAMATEALERHALVVAGGQATQACSELHALLLRHGASVSERVDAAAAFVLEVERIDDRYLAFERVQRRMMSVIESIPAEDLDAAAQTVLVMAHTVQAAHAEWALQRALDFAASREEPPLSHPGPANLADESTSAADPQSVETDDAAPNSTPDGAAFGQDGRPSTMAFAAGISGSPAPAETTPAEPFPSGDGATDPAGTDSSS